ncbi:MAG: ABC-type transport auxiliary lipoprotein family protein [Alphaproteobacteria bacterium]
MLNRLRPLAIVVALVAAACGNPLEKPAPEQRFFSLDAVRTEPARTATPEVLAVRRFRASPGFDGRELLYRTGPNAFQSDFYNLYIAAPSSLIAAQAAEWLGRSGLFRAVVSTGSQADPRYVLEGQVVSIHGDFAGTAAAVLETQFFLIDTRATGSTVVLDRTYRETAPLSERSAPALAAGLGVALAATLRRLEADIAGTLAGR